MTVFVLKKGEAFLFLFKRQMQQKVIKKEGFIN